MLLRRAETHGTEQSRNFFGPIEIKIFSEKIFQLKKQNSINLLSFMVHEIGLTFFMVEKGNEL